MAYWATANWMCQRFSHTAPNPLKNPTFYLVEAGFQVGFLKKGPLLLNKKWDFLSGFSNVRFVENYDHSVPMRPFGFFQQYLR